MHLHVAFYIILSSIFYALGLLHYRKMTVLRSLASFNLLCKLGLLYFFCFHCDDVKHNCEKHSIGHYENTHKFHHQNWKFSDKKSNIFHISAQKHRLWVLVRTALVYPCKPQFYCVKKGLRRSKCYRYVFF